MSEQGVWQQFQEIGDRIRPMLEAVAQEYGPRTPAGYPVVVDDRARGAIGLLLDPGHALHLLTDGDGLYAEVTARSARSDARSSAGREKYAGTTFNDRRPLDPGISDQGLRNLVAELVARWNMQPTLIHITDT